MKLFSQADIEKINRVAAKSKETLSPPKATKGKSINTELNAITEKVLNYFKDSDAILITSVEQLHEYVDKFIEAEIGSIDTETTGLDRIRDTIVGSSLYYPGGVECYIPNKHLIPIFDEPYKNQLTYEQVGAEFQRIVDAKCKVIFANADFDLSMIYKDYKVDMCDVCYYDVILAWRCLKENEKDNALKVLYNKYVLKGKGDPMKFNDFFSPALFPYCKPEVAKLYAANDAKITYELYEWQLPYTMKDHPKCKKNHLESIADLIWNVELPLIKVCQMLHRRGVYIDQNVVKVLQKRYHSAYDAEIVKLQQLVQEVIDNTSYSSATRRPFNTGKDFNEASPVHVKYLLYTMMGVAAGKNGQSTDKEVLKAVNHPVTNQILKVRGLSKLLNTYVDKLPKVVAPDGKIHARFNSVGADTGRMSSADPNMQNIPSHAEDIRHMFRASPGYVMLSSDYSAQEPRITAYVSQDPKMIQSFKEGKDIYASIASIAFNVPYEQCLEFHPETGEYQPEGKKRRGEAKTIVLGICYGRSVVTIAEQLFGGDSSMSDEEKQKKAQNVYDSVLNAFPNLRQAMLNAQNNARTKGYVETILGRRRHLPDMTLPEFEFVPREGYVNPDIDPLNPATLHNRSAIPPRIVKALQEEFKQYKYFGQIARRTKELYEKYNIRVINNRAKITDATRQCLNSVIQGSAAEQTKMAMLLLENDPEWKEIGGRLILPVHDELIAEVPIENYKRGGELLSSLMCKAAEFLPFPSKCDVTTMTHWYGLEYPCPYTKPNSFEYLTPDEIKWIQYYLVQSEYILPVYEDENGDKPRGDAAKGVNGIWSDEVESFVDDYLAKNRIDKENFFDHIEHKVIYCD